MADLDWSKAKITDKNGKPVQSIAQPPEPDWSQATITPPPTLTGDFSKGVSSGTDNLQSAGYGAIAAGMESIGATGARDWAEAGMKRNNEEAAQNAPSVTSLDDVHGTGDFAHWLAGGAGQLAPSLVQSAITQLGGRKLGLKTGINQNAAGFATSMAGNTAVQTGSIYSDILEKTGQRDPGKALGYGLATAAMDTVSELPVMKALDTPSAGGLANRMITGFAKQAPIEGLTEGLQRIGERAAVLDADPTGQQKIFSPEGVSEIRDAAALGLAGGGMVGAASHGLSPQSDDNPPPPPPPPSGSELPPEPIAPEPAPVTPPPAPIADDPVLPPDFVGTAEDFSNARSHVEQKVAEAAAVDPNNGVLSRVVNMGAQNGAVANKAAEEATAAVAEQQAQEDKKPQASEVDVTPPQRDYTDEDLVGLIKTQLAAGNQVWSPQMAKDLGVEPSRAFAARALAKQQLEAEMNPDMFGTITDEGTIQQPIEAVAPEPVVEAAPVTPEVENTSFPSFPAANKALIQQGLKGTHAPWADGKGGYIIKPIEDTTNEKLQPGQQSAAIPEGGSEASTQVFTKGFQSDTPSAAQGQEAKAPAGDVQVADVVKSDKGYDLYSADSSSRAGEGASPAEIILNPEQTKSDVNDQMQNRDRSRAASVQQMKQIANNPDYDRLSEAKDPEHGAPMAYMNNDAHENIPALGKQDVVTFEDGGKTPIRYAVVDAESLQASHNSDGAVNPEYAQDLPDGILRSLNNGRTSGLQQAYRQGTAEAYRSSLRANAASLGIDAAAIDAIANPVLVRLYSEKENTKDIGARSNAGGGLRLSPSEQAKTDASMLEHLDDMTLNDDGEFLPSQNRSLVSRFLKQLPRTEGGALVNRNGEPTDDLIKRLKNAVLSKAYGDNDLIEAATESSDFRNLMNALNIAAPKMASLPSDEASGLRRNIVAAAQLFRKAKNENTTVKSVLDQGSLFGGAPEPETAALAEFMETHARSPKQLGEALRIMGDYIDSAYHSRNDIFGDTLPETAKAYFDYANKQLKEKYGDKAKLIDATIVQEGKVTGRAQAAHGNGPRLNNESGEAGRDQAEGQQQEDLKSQEEFSLASYTNEEIAAKEADAREEADKEALADKDAERKAKADAEVGQFVLTGSDRISDVAAAAGQNDLFGAGKRAIRNSDEPNLEAAKKLLNEDYKKTVGNKLAEGKVRKAMIELAKKTPMSDEATVLALDMLATRLDYDSKLELMDSQESSKSTKDLPVINEDAPSPAVTQVEVSDITAATYKQWKKAVDHLGKVNGWDLFKDDINNTYSLMTPYSHARPFSTEEVARSWAADNKAKPLGYFKKSDAEPSKESSNSSNSEEQKTKDLAPDERKAKDWAMSLIDKLKGNDPVLVDGNSKTWKLSMDLPAWLRGANVKSLWASANVTSGQTETKLSWTLENSDTEYKQLLIGTSSLKGNSRITVQYTELAEARAASEPEAKEKSIQERLYDVLGKDIYERLPRSIKEKGYHTLFDLYDFAERAKRAIGETKSKARESGVYDYYNLDRDYVSVEGMMLLHLSAKENMITLDAKLNSPHRTGAALSDVLSAWEKYETSKREIEESKVTHKAEWDAYEKRQAELLKANVGDTVLAPRAGTSEFHPAKLIRKGAKNWRVERIESGVSSLEPIQSLKPVDSEATPKSKESNGSDFDPAAFIKIAADSIDKLRPQDVDRVLADAYALGEDQLAAVTEYIAKNNSKLREEIKIFFEEVAGFLDGTTDKRIKMFVDVGMRRRNASDLRESVAKNFGEDLAGLQLKGASDRYAFFLPDASNAGKFRVTHFDKNGLSGHTTYDTYAKALDEAIQDGYKTEAPGSLEKLSELDSFKAGNEWAHKLQAVHDGKITWADFVAGKDANEKQAEAKDPLGVSEERELSDYIASDYRNASNSTAIAGSGWVMHDDSINSAGTIQLVSASRNVIRDIKYDPKSGTDHRRAIVKATVWAQENPDKFEAPKGELVSKPVFTANRNEFTVERFDRDADENKTERFERGEYVRAMISKDKSAFGEIDGISQARNEASVDGLWYGFGSIYKAGRPVKSEENRVPLGDVIDSVNKKHGEGLTDDDKVKAPSKTPSVDRHNEVISTVNAGKATPEEFKASFNAIVDNADAIKAELATKTKAELLSSGGGFIRSRYASEIKPRIIDAIYRQMLGDYVLSSSLTYGMGKGAYEAAVRQQVEATDADSLAAYAAELVKRNEESDAKRASAMAGIEDPKTPDDFRNIIRLHKAKGKTFTEARLMMTPDQRAEYDRLEAETTRESRLARKRAAKTQVKAAGQTVGGEIIATKHTKKGHDLFAVQLAERVSKDDYGTLNAAAKRLGGYYSSFRAGGAIPGFQFTDKGNAEAFLQLAEGDTAAAKEAAEQRRDAFDDDRSQSAVERLNEMADRLEGRADEVLNADRKTNTHRRAAMAARAEGAANIDKALASTMRNLAKAIEDGKAEFLDAVRQKTQIEMLEAMVKRAKDNEIRAKYPNYGDQQKHAGEKPSGETADHAEFPAFTAYRSDLASLARKMLEVEGTKKIGKQLMSVADDVSDAYIKFAKENLDRVSQFGRGDKLADFGSREDAEKAIKRSNLVGKAIVLPVKRGQNRIVLSPSEAINREIWTGDGDKRITLSKDFGMEMVQAIGRRGSRANGLTVPWQLETAADRLKALDRIGIETPAEFRSALREFIGLREQAAEPDKIKEMERKMIGRRNDGLDFFPTPESVADEMVQAADIQPGMTVLEPSAGMGHIAERIKAAGVDPDVIEMSGDRKELLEAKGFNVIARDFMEIKPREFFTYGDVFKNKDGVLGVMRGSGGMGSNRVGFDPLDDNGEPDKRRSMWENRDDLEGVRHRGFQSGYDRIIMNPPFSDRRDAEHVQHAYELLRPGGRIVAIMGEGVFYGSDKKAQAFRDWLESVGGTDEKLPDGTFLDPSLPVNTGVNTRMVVIDKPESGSSTQALLGLLKETGKEVKEADDEGAKFRRGGADAAGMKPVQVRSIVSSIASKWKNAPQIVVANSVAELPFKAPADAAGAFHNGKVYLVAGNLRNRDHAEFVLLHEALGHYGLSGVLGNQIKPAMRTIYQQNRSVRDLADKYLKENDGASIDLAVEEALSDLAGTKLQKLNGFQRLVAAVRNAIRALGFKLELSDNDVLYMMGKAREFVEKGTTVTGNQESARFMSGFHEEAPNDISPIGFYSPLARAARNLVQQKGTPEQMLAMLERQKGVKPAEIEATGLKEYLELASRPTPDGVSAVYDYYGDPLAREIAHDAKDGDEKAIKEMAIAMAKLIPEGSTLVPVPSRNGKAEMTLKLAMHIADITGSDIANVLTGNKRESLYDIKKSGGKLNSDQLGISASRSGIKNPVLIDNVFATGATMAAIKKALPDAVMVAFARDTTAMPYKPAIITKQQIVDYLASNGVQVQESMLGAGKEPKLPDGWTVKYDREEDAWIVYDQDGDEMADGTSREDAIEMAMDDDVRADNADLAGDTKFGQYVLPGGKNYRELLLTLPSKSDAATKRLEELQVLAYDAEQEGNKELASKYHREAERISSENNGKTVGSSPDFRSSHYDQPNILAHVRFNERTDADGKRVLFLEELQSDWAQSGRKSGFDEKTGSLDVRPVENGDGWWEVFNKDTGKVEFDDRSFGDAQYKTQQEARAAMSRFNELAENYDGGAGIPVAPFVTSTDAWVGLAMKRMIAYAAENGFDRIAWTTGEQQADRYDLSKRVDAVDVHVRDGKRHVRVDVKGEESIKMTVGDDGAVDIRSTAHMAYDGKKLDEIIGKELADKAMAVEEGDQFTGDDLKVGGQGMKSFYDQIVPKVAKEITKKMGGQLTSVTLKAKQEGGNEFRVQQSDDMENFGKYEIVNQSGRPHPSLGRVKYETREEAQNVLRDLNSPTTKQSGFDITPEMRQTTLKGMPLFSRNSLTDALYSNGILGDIQQNLADRFTKVKTFNLWDRTVGTQFHKAWKDAEFKKVFDDGQNYLNDVSRFAMEAADQAPGLLPKVELGSVVNTIANYNQNRRDQKAIAAPVYEGTLSYVRDPVTGEARKADETEAGGIVFSNTELRDLFKLNDRQISLYRQFRAAVDQSLEGVGVSEAARELKSYDEFQPVLRDAKYKPDGAMARILNTVEDRAVELERGSKEDKKEAVELRKVLAGLKDKHDKIEKLKANGYAPLMRFGEYAVTVKDKQGEVKYFELFESKPDMLRRYRAMKETYPQDNVTFGVMNDEKYKLYKDISPDTLELFAEALGADKTDIFQDYLKLAKNNRSALKRLIQRKGIAGYSEDSTRTLAQFITSNARHSSSNYHMGEMEKHVRDVSSGDAQKEAVRLWEYVKNPTEEAAKLRGYLFINFIGGSIASAIVNMTQPVTMTFPYLSQWGAAKASAALAAAGKVGATGKTNDKLLEAAMKRATEEGIVAPHEIHQLYAEAIQGLGRNPVMRAALTTWGAPFAMAEAFNRRVTFAAAFNMAQGMTAEQLAKAGVQSKYQFAVKAVYETQGIYNRGNRPDWARGAIGATLFTFKQFSVSYLEFLRRLPPREKMIALGVLVLFSGLQGLPGADDAEDVIDTIAQGLGYNFDSKKALRESIMDSFVTVLGEDAGRFMGGIATHGSSSFLPVDIQARMSLGNLIPGTSLMKRSQENKGKEILEVLGPAGGLAQNIMDGATRAMTGDVVGGALKMAPMAIQNAVKGATAAATGEYRDEQGRKITTATKAEGSWKGIGFQPARIAQESRLAQSERQSIALTRGEESAIVDIWAKGIAEGDKDMISEAQDRLRAWNAKNPDTKIRISPNQIKQRVKGLRSDRIQRLLKTAPKEMRAGVMQRISGE